VGRSIGGGLSTSTAHQRLVAELNRPPAGTDLARLAHFAGSLLTEYSQPGARGCVTFERQAIASYHRITSGAGAAS
jgi:hypothetical protein